MKNKPLFIQIMMVIIIALICLVLTVGIAILAGSLKVNLFDFQNMNFSNMIPILLIGGFISCAIVGICILFLAHTAFIKAKDYFKKTNNKNGGTEQ